MNTDEKVYSQGYNLAKWLSRAVGGGHHVLPHRPFLMDYSVKALDPRVPSSTTNSEESYYLIGQSRDYPTALLDSDGNERAVIHLRNSDLNLLHILLQQLSQTSLQAEAR